MSERDACREVIGETVYLAQEAVPHMKPGLAKVNNGSVTSIDGSKELVD